MANSGDRDATTWSNFILETVMPREENCDSICANHSSGSFGQKGGSLICTAATWAGWAGLACTAEGSESIVQCRVTNVSK